MQPYHKIQNVFKRDMENGGQSLIEGEFSTPEFKYLADQDFILFDVRIGSWWLQRSDVEAIAEKLGISVVPVILTSTLRQGIDLIRNGGFGSYLSQNPLNAEGVIGRPTHELTARNGGRIITKIKTCDFSNN